MSEQNQDLNPSEYDEIPDESEQLDQDPLQPYHSLEDRGVDDALDEGYSPPERYSALQRSGAHETMDERLADEEPDVNGLTEEDLADDDTIIEDHIDDGEVGGARAGRLVDPNEGIGEDEEGSLIGEDVGIDGAAASAEEAAVHVVDDEQAF